MEMTAHAIGADHHDGADRIPGRTLHFFRADFGAARRDPARDLLAEMLLDRMPVTVERRDEFAIRRDRPVGPAPGAVNTCVAPVELLKIHEVQGNGAASPEAGNTVAIEGIVVGEFQDGASGTNGDLNGFYTASRQMMEMPDDEGPPREDEPLFHQLVLKFCPRRFHPIWHPPYRVSHEWAARRDHASRRSR